MSTNTDNTAVDQAAHDAAVAAAREDGRKAGFDEGATAERTRIGAILQSEEAKGRESLASHFAFSTAMTPEDAIAALAAAPKQAEAPSQPESGGGSTPFDQAMNEGNPGVGASASGGSDDDSADGADAIALARSVGLPGVRRAQS